MPSVEGVAARRVALQILDQVLRRGRTIDAASANGRNLAPNDLALAIAIAGEALRRLRDIDELIDSTTRTRLPSDSKARAVLRLALAQKVGLGTPDHAVVSTALPLLDGGPRRLAHGILGTLLRRGVPVANSSKLPNPVEERWGEWWGKEAVLAARRQIVRRPDLDLTFASPLLAQRYAEQNGGCSLASGHVRLQSRSVEDLPDFEEGSWWIQDLAASLPARLVPSNAVNVLDLCAAPGGKTMQLSAAGHS